MQPRPNIAKSPNPILDSGGRCAGTDKPKALQDNWRRTSAENTDPFQPSLTPIGIHWHTNVSPDFRQTSLGLDGLKKCSSAKEGQTPVEIIQFLFELIGSHCAAQRSILAFGRRAGFVLMCGAQHPKHRQGTAHRIYSSPKNRSSG